MPPKPLQRVLAVICVIRWESAANERAQLRACQVEVGSGAFRLTARTEEEEQTSVSSTAAKVLRSAGERQAAADCCWTERRREGKALDRKDSQHSSLCRSVGFSVVSCTRLAC